MLPSNLASVDKSINLNYNTYPSISCVFLGSFFCLSIHHCDVVVTFPIIVVA